MRWYPSVQKYRSRNKSVSGSSWITVIIAVSMCVAVLVTDLLLFQLPDRKADFKFKQTDKNFYFTDGVYTQGSAKYYFPEVLRSNQTAEKIFGKNIYISNDQGRYVNYSTYPEYLHTVDGPKYDPANYGTPQCTVSHLIVDSNARFGFCPVRVRCFLDANNSEVQPFDKDELDHTIGVTERTITTFFQTNKGANYLFVKLVKRTFDNFKADNGNTSIKNLEALIKGVSEEGYKLKAVTMNFSPFNLTKNTEPIDIMKIAQVNRNLDLKSQTDQQSRLNFEKIAACMFLYSKTEITYKHGKIPVYTKKFVLWSTYFQLEFFNGTGNGTLYSNSYNTRQYFVKGGKLRESIYGRNLTNLKNVPISAQIRTDRTDDKVVLATLENPNHPLQVIDTEMVDIFPGVIVIGICGLLLLSAMVTRKLVNRDSNRKLLFDVNLEVLHKALENLNGLNAWYLPAKLEQTKGITMTKGVSLMSSLFSIGLVCKESGDDESPEACLILNRADEIQETSTQEAYVSEFFLRVRY